ncbi:MAG: AraC-like DNA-binding protein [Cyanobium sp.]|jgi:AraC-like DNA-binding protein
MPLVEIAPEIASWLRGTQVRFLPSGGKANKFSSNEAACLTGRCHVGSSLAIAQVCGQGLTRVEVSCHLGHILIGFGLYGQFSGSASKRPLISVPNRFAFLLFPGEILELSMESAKVSGMVIQLSERRLNEEVALRTLHQPDLRNLGDSIPGHEALMIACGNQLIQLKDQESSSARDRLMRLLEDSIMALLGNLAAVGSSQPVEDFANLSQQLHVKKAMAFVENNLGESLTLSDLCRVCNVSARTLQASFQVVLQRTPAQAVQGLRLTRWREMLLRGQDLANACNAVGLVPSGRMSSYYRRMFSELPSQTRLRAAVR